MIKTKARVSFELEDVDLGRLDSEGDDYILELIYQNILSAEASDDEEGSLKKSLSVKIDEEVL